MSNKQQPTNAVTEGISGAVPIGTMGEEFGSAILMLAIFTLPVILAQITRMTFTNEQVKSLAQKVVEFVRKDIGKDSLKNKIARGINEIVQKFTSSNNTTVEAEPVKQDVLNVLPDNIESKSTDTIETEVRARLTDLKRRNSRYSVR